jgi:hypothetical protein
MHCLHIRSDIFQYIFNVFSTNLIEFFIEFSHLCNFNSSTFLAASCKSAAMFNLSVSSAETIALAKGLGGRGGGALVASSSDGVV